MVERPIKRSDPQHSANNPNSADSPAQNTESETRGSSRRKDTKDNRSKGKTGKGRKFEEKAPPVNPALARGPKPVKLQPEPEPEPEIEATAETETDIPAETEAVAAE